MKNTVLRKEFKDLPKHVNWFPGHMRKARRDLEDEFKKINMFIEVRDARVPQTSQNPELISMIPEGKKRLVVYNKIDLANEKKSLEIIK